MFYSHEILSSSQYGVATIWLVATVGKGTSRKVTRKAIQEVNVPKACETIIEPGAPLALRLQGNLLYGTARVFAQQCGYVLSDAEKTQSDMMTFFRVIQTSETDPSAGKTKRQSIILPDDPNFDPFANIPSLDLLLTAVEHRIGPSQGSSGGYSQLSPPDLSQVLLQPMGRSSEQTPSSRSAGSRYISIGSVQDLDPFSKSAHQAESRMDLDLLDDEQTPAIDFGLEIDEDGMWRMADGSDADLPALPGLAASRPSTGANMQDPMNMQDEEMLLVDGDGLILEEPVLPEAEAFPDHAQQASNGVSATTSEETGRASAKHKRVYRRKAKQPLTLDHEDKISRNEFRNWSQNYARNMEARRQHPKGVTPARAKQNAWNLISGYGVSAVGRLGVHDGSAHPLASFFAGDALEALLEGRDPAEILKKETMTTGRRRTSDEAFGEEEDGDESRRVKARTDEIGRNLQHDDDDMLMLDNDEAPEMGRDPGSAMTDRHSSTVMPWIRPGSVVQISSARRAGSAQRLGTPSSPLRRLAKLAPINRHSDPPVALSDDLHIAQFSDDSSLHQLLPEPDSDDLDRLATLDTESQKVLGYVTKHAMGKPVDEANKKRWVEFDQLADPKTDNREIAATMFLHVLGLATKGIIGVEQKSAQEMVPFGTIRVGVPAELCEGLAISDDALVA